MINVVFSGYSSMECVIDEIEQNNWDADHNNVQSDKFLSGMYSYHNNHYEDRRFKWRYCEPNGHRSIQNIQSLSETSYDAEWTRSCSGRNGGYSALVGATSYHNNHREDRQWTFYCGDVQNDYYFEPGACSWTNNYVNNWDNEVDYQCPNNGIMRSISSYHSNHYEDRRWKFECCRVSDKQEGISIPKIYPENPVPYIDPEDYKPPSSFPLNYLSLSSLSSFINIIFVLLLINCICLTYYNFIKSNKNKNNKYKVVSMHSDSEREDLKL